MPLKAIANRVKDFFQRKPAVQSREESVMTKTISPMKSPRLPNEIPYVLPKIVQQLRERRAKMLSRQSQKPLPMPKEQEIIPSKIHRWKLRDPHDILHKIQEISQTRPSARHYKIDKILDLEQEREREKMGSDLWEEALKSKEERHFRMDRITNFFS